MGFAVVAGRHYQGDLAILTVEELLMQKMALGDHLLVLVYHVRAAHLSGLEPVHYPVVLLLLGRVVVGLAMELAVETDCLVPEGGDGGGGGAAVGSVIVKSVEAAVASGMGSWVR